MGFLNGIGGIHFLLILVVVLFLFGAPKLPGLAKSIGQSIKILKSEVKTDKKNRETTGLAQTEKLSDSETGTDPDNEKIV